MKTIKEFFIKYKYLLINSLLLHLFFELTTRTSIVNVIKWVLTHPLYFFMNIIIIFILMLLVNYCFNKLYAYIIVNTLFIFIGVINYLKVNIRKSAFMPKDLMLFDELLGIFKNIFTPKVIIITSISMVLYFAIVLLIYQKIERHHWQITFNYKKVLFTLVLAIALLMTTQSTSFTADGYFYYFYSNITTGNSLFSFHRQVDDELINKYLADQPVTKDDRPIEDKPNIVVIMSEGFWNPNLLEEVEFNVNPAKNFEALSKESIHGYLKAPVFGGGTANSEFEVLTGINTSFYTHGTMMYEEHIHQPIMSLASILRKQGYQATAIHPHTNWYYQRNKIYQYLGFNNFLSKEYLINPEYKGYYISDAQVNKDIIETMESTTSPDFIYAITMQNHGPYNDNRYEDTLDISVNNIEDEEMNRTLTTFGQGIYDADQALGDLINHFEQADEKTIVLFFGDHLPFLGSGNKIYKNFGLEDNNLLYPYYSAPFLLWSNYKDQNEEIPLMNMTYVGHQLLDYGDLEKPQFHRFLKAINSKFPVINGNSTLNSSNIFTATNESEEFIQLKDLLEKYQNQILSNNLDKNDSNYVINNNSSFNDRYENIRVTTVDEQDNTLIIKADNFYNGMILSINDEARKYDWISNEEIRINNFENDLDNTKIRLQLIDDKENVIAEWKNY